MKNNFNNYSYLLAFALFAILFSCGRDEVVMTPLDDDNPIVFPEPAQVITTSVLGQVLSEEGLPLEGASVTCLSCITELSMETDSTGNFLFQQIENKGISAFISIEYRGMFKAFRRLGVLEDRFNYTEIKLQKKQSIGEVDATKVGTLIHESGATISFTENSIVDESGQRYNGTFEVVAAWINPEAQDLNQNMIGDLSGIDESGAIQALSTYGMLVVELLDPSGNELNLLEGEIAILKFPIPESLVATAPETIPLWSYDEENGYWVEEGEAQLDGNFYVGSVGHFSSWNVDTKGAAIDISGQIVIRAAEMEAIPAYFEVFVSGPSIGQRGGWLCEDGSFLFFNFPANESFRLEILDYCGNVVYQEDHQGYDESLMLSDIFIAGSSVEFQSLSGSAINCEREVVNNGLVYLIVDEKFFVFPLAGGHFDFVIPVCENINATLQVFDIDNLTVSDPIMVTQIDATFTYDDIFICSGIQNFAQYSVNGVPFFFAPEGDFFFAELMDPNSQILVKQFHIWDIDSSARSELEIRFEDSFAEIGLHPCLLYTSPSPRDGLLSRMPSSA